MKARILRRSARSASIRWHISRSPRRTTSDWRIAKKANPKGLTGKPYGLFYSHGGGGAVRGPLAKLFQGIGTLVGDVVESKGAPDKKTLDACAKLGRDLAATATAK